MILATVILPGQKASGLTHLEYVETYSHNNPIHILHKQLKASSSVAFANKSLHILSRFDLCYAIRGGINDLEASCVASTRGSTSICLIAPVQKDIEILVAEYPIVS